jgi:hypothetical protein
VDLAHVDLDELEDVGAHDSSNEPVVALRHVEYAD